MLSDPVEAFVAQHIPGCARGFGNCVSIGFTDDTGQLEAGVVYHNWQPECGVIELSAASINRTWLNRQRLKQIFAFPFDQIECRIAVARISEHNTLARRIWRSLGAEEYRIPQLRSPTEDEMIYTLHADKWRAGKFLR